jgi:hypothetical protein
LTCHDASPCARLSHIACQHLLVTAVMCWVNGEQTAHRSCCPHSTCSLNRSSSAGMTKGLDDSAPANMDCVSLVCLQKHRNGNVNFTGIESCSKPASACE